MLEHLGLGVVLSLEDDFTPQVNKALSSFDRLQGGAEKMVGKLQQSMMSLQNVMLAGFSISEVGQSIESTGNKILNTLANIGKGFTKTNAEYQTMQKQLLTSFKNNSQEAEKAFSWIKDFSVATPFTVEDLTTSMQKLKSQGIDIRDSFKSATGEAKTLAEAMGDLATLNMGATGGVSNMGYALQEAWAGQKRSLITRFNLANSDIAPMMQYAGKDVKKFEEEFVKLAQKITPNAMKNMGGTWSMVVSNMQDAWHNFQYDIGKTGIFDDMIKSLSKIQVAMSEVFSDPKSVQAMSNIIRGVLDPLNRLVGGFLIVGKALITFSKEHPALSKFLATFTAVSAITMVVTGSMMNLAGKILITFASISSLVINLRLMTMMGLTATSAFEGLGGAITRTLGRLSVLGLVGAGLFFAWQRDLGGLKTKSEGVFEGIKSGWTTALRAVKDNDFRSALFKSFGGDKGELNFKYNIKLPPLVEAFSGKFLTIIAVTKAFWKVFTGTFDNGKMHFSDKDWDLYEKVGIAGLVRGMVAGKFRIDAFFKGISDGLSSVYTLMSKFVDTVAKPIKALIDSIKEYNKNHPNGILGSLIVGKQGIDVSVASQQVSSMEKLGKATGIIVASLVGFKAVTSIGTVLLSPFTRLFNTLSKIGDKAKEVKQDISMVGMTRNGASKYEEWNNKAEQYLHPYRYKEEQQQRRKQLYEEFESRGLQIPKELDTRTKMQKFRALVERDGFLTSTKWGRTDGKFTDVDPSDVYKTYADHNLAPQLNGRQLQVKNRSYMMRALFGDKFYADNGNGTKQQIGKFGGLFGYFSGRNDRQMEDKLTQMYARRGDMPIDDQDEDNRTHRPILGSYVGRVFGMKGAQANNLRSQVSSLGRSITRLSRSQFNRFASVRQRELLKDFNNLSNKPELKQAEADRLAYYNSVGLNDTNVAQIEAQMGSDLVGKHHLMAVRQGRALNAINSDRTYQALRQRGDAEVYGDNRQSFISRLLTGQRLYTVDQDAEGNMTRQVIGRRGGLLPHLLGTDGAYNSDGATIGDMARRRYQASRLGQFQARHLSANGMRALANRVRYSNLATNIMATGVNMRDGLYNRGTQLRDGFLNSRAVSLARATGSRISSTASNIGDWASTRAYNASNAIANSRIGRAGSWIANSSAGRFTGRVARGVGRRASALGSTIRQSGIMEGARAVGRWGNRQLERMGYSPIQAPSTRGALRSTGRFLFGGYDRDENGNVRLDESGNMMRRRGAISRGVRGAGRGLMAVGRGIGAVGGVAMRALPFVGAGVALGRMAFGGIAGKGAELMDGGGSKMQQFNAGLNFYRNMAKNMNLSKIWDDFKKEGGQSLKVIVDIAKTAWQKLKPILPGIMNEAWTGIKGMAKVAWEWIKTDGVIIMGKLATTIIDYLGKAWKYVYDNGGAMFGKLVSWVITDALPGIVRGIVGLGIFIVTHIPDALAMVAKLGLGIFGGLFTGIVAVFKGIGSVIWEGLKGVLSGLKGLVLGMLGGAIRAVPVVGDKVANALGLGMSVPNSPTESGIPDIPTHHGGLWMSDNEHGAIIKRDETVLPSDKARKLDALLESVSKSNNSKAVNGGGDGTSISVDKVEIIVKADRLSPADARKQAIQIIDELKKIKRENQVRRHEDILTTGLNF
jgi:hypothetical protein